MESDSIDHNLRKGSALFDRTGIEEQIRDLQLRLAALSRRVEELETTTFKLVDEEEVILVAVPSIRKTGRVY